MPSPKEQHEIAVARALLLTLGHNAQFVRHGLDGIEPDVIFSSDGLTLGIEIATAYYNEDDAKADWDLARGISQFDSDSIAPLGPILIGPDKLIASAVQRELDDKCSKTYSRTDLVWLCVYEHAALAEVSETEDLITRLKIPNKHPFEKIYLGFYAPLGDGGGFRVYDLLEKISA